MASNILSYLGWSFLPNFVTGNLQSFYYNITIRAGDPKPQPGSPLFVKHRRRIHIAVIVIYLLYTVYEADWTVRREGTFYQALGVPYDVDEKALQTRFRRLTLLHHPDKITNPSNRAAAEQYYISLKLARDTLLDPAKRFAYDRFGVDTVEWKQCTTTRDFVLSGIRALIPFYGGSILVMLIFGWLGIFTSGKYWRYLAFAALGAFELYTVTRPFFPTITFLPTIFNPLLQLPIPLPVAARMPYLPFQALQVAHKAVITVFIAINQLGPLLQEPSRAASPLDTSEGAVLRQVEMLEQLVRMNAVESARLLGLEGAPFVRPDGRGGVQLTSDVMQGKVKDWFVTNAVRNDKEVRDAVIAVVERRGGTVGALESPGEVISNR